jgi:hypothetical protein
MQGHILFPGNPWPDGHAVNEFSWHFEISEEAEFFLHLHLKSDDYDANDPEADEDDSESEDDDDESSWTSKIVWGNYHTCTMSSSKWGDQGILIPPGKPLDFTKWGKRTFTADPLPLQTDDDGEFDWEDLAFHIYLLGHDACADHRITIVQNAQNAQGRFDIDWQGKIALAYVGSTDFCHDFKATIKDAAFDGIHYPQAWSQAQALEAIKPYVANAERLQFVDLNTKSKKREYKLMPL